MCYGIAGTIDDKMKVRSKFTNSHDERGNKPDEVRRTYWEWELYYPFKPKDVVFTNEDEKAIGKKQIGMQNKVIKFLKFHHNKILEALVAPQYNQGLSLLGKGNLSDMDTELAKIGNIFNIGARIRNVHNQRATMRTMYNIGTKIDNIENTSAKIGSMSNIGATIHDIDNHSAQIKTMNNGSATIKSMNINYMQVKDKVTTELITEFSNAHMCRATTLANFVKWLIKKKGK